MTRRAILLGFLGVVALCGFNYINDNILRQTYLIGNNLPVSVYGLLIIFVLAVNPLLFRLRQKSALSGRELTVVITMVLACCCIPASGLMRTFTNSLILPHHYARTSAGWTQAEVIQYAPPQMLADISSDEDTVLNGFVQGLGDGQESIGFQEVPWHAWARTLAFWMPLILALWLALTALSVVIHRQWSRHEHLPYPIADFANALLPESGRPRSRLLGNRQFLIAALIVFLLHFNNFLWTCFPDVLIPIKRQLGLAPLAQLLPFFERGGGARLLNPVIYLSVVGFAYFIPRDVSFSLGIGPFLWYSMIGLLMGYGINVNAPVGGASWYLSPKPGTFLLFGANVGVFLAVAFCGRHYYARVFGRALHPSSPEPEDRTAVWGVRLFLFCLAAFWLQLCLVGLDWQLATLYTAILLVFYVVMSRILAETGLFYIQPFFFPCVIILGTMGAGALGPVALTIMFMLSVVLVIDPRESLMPFVVNSLKLLEDRRLNIGRGAWLCCAAILLGLLVAVPLTLYFQYNLGFSKFDGWAAMVPRMAFDNVVSVSRVLEAQGALEQAEALQGWSRFGAMRPNSACMIALGAGLLLALLTYAARFRFPSWPIHPVLFLTWGTEPTFRLCGSFLIGWAIKSVVVKYGGVQTYQKLRPLAFGVIAGEILGAIVPSLITTVMYFITGEPPPLYRVLPG